MHWKAPPRGLWLGPDTRGRVRCRPCCWPVLDEPPVLTEPLGDGGKNWARMDASQFMVWRPFYFANLIVDPKDENKIFKPDLMLLLSVNGGRSFSGVSNEAHGDF